VNADHYCLDRGLTSWGRWFQPLSNGRVFLKSIVKPCITPIKLIEIPRGTKVVKTRAHYGHEWLEPTS
jgi:hypothetical protein